MGEINHFHITIVCIPGNRLVTYVHGRVPGVNAENSFISFYDQND